MEDLARLTKLFDRIGGEATISSVVETSDIVSPPLSPPPAINAEWLREHGKIVDYSNPDNSDFRDSRFDWYHHPDEACFDAYTCRFSDEEGNTIVGFDVCGDRYKEKYHLYLLGQDLWQTSSLLVPVGFTSRYYAIAMAEELFEHFVGRL
jgi:hypothetical protein